MADFGVQPPRESAFEGELEFLDALLMHAAARLRPGQRPLRSSLKGPNDSKSQRVDHKPPRTARTPRALFLPNASTRPRKT